MAIAVVHAASILDDTLIFTPRLKKRAGELLGFLTSLGPNAAGDGPDLSVSVALSDDGQTLPIPLARFLSAAEYELSVREPLSLVNIEALRGVRTQDAEWVWLFAGAFYVCDRKPATSEREEVVLQVKALHYQRSDRLKRLREQVANYEAIESHMAKEMERRPLPDDVKLLVWTRDGGVCVRCGASKDLHFDHIIPLSRGGGDQAGNIQLLCRTCNLAKSARLA
jgi:5-methylcytosine-specific restriction endonuclease McrA